jgi:hypothetical protein
MAPMLRRNARSAFDLLGTMLRYLRGQGYEFAFMSELCDEVSAQQLPELAAEKVVR